MKPALTSIISLFLLCGSISCTRSDLFDELMSTQDEPFFLILLSSTPPDNESEVSLSRIIALCFNDNIDMATVTAETIIVSPAKTFTYSYDTVNKIVYMTPQSDYSENTFYTLRVTSSVTNIAGEGLVEERTINFTTTAAGVPDMVIHDGIRDLYPESTIDFGILSLGGAVQEKVLTIENQGNGDLTITGIALADGLSGVFALSHDALPLTVTPSAFSAITITADPFISGVTTDSLVVTSDDPDRSSFPIYLTSTALSVLEPEIHIMQDLNDMPSGSTYDFGTVKIGSTSYEVIFTVQNQGTADLIISGITVDAKDISVLPVSAEEPPLVVQPGDSTELSAVFAPTGVGIRLATVTIANNDSDEGAYIIKLKGRGVK